MEETLAGKVASILRGAGAPPNPPPTEDEMGTLVEYAAVLRKRTKDSLQIKHLNVEIHVIDASYLALIVLGGVESVQMVIHTGFDRESLVRTLAQLLYLRTSTLHTIRLAFDPADRLTVPNEIQGIIKRAESEEARLDKTMLPAFLVLLGFDRAANATELRNTAWAATILAHEKTTEVGLGGPSAPIVVFNVVDAGEDCMVEMEAVSGKRGAEEMGPVEESVVPLDRADEFNARLTTGFEFFAVKQFTGNISHDEEMARQWWKKYIVPESGEDLSDAWVARVNAVLKHRGSLAQIRSEMPSEDETVLDGILELTLLKGGAEFARVQLLSDMAFVEADIKLSVEREFELQIVDAIRDFRIVRFYDHVELRQDVVYDWFRNCAINTGRVAKLLKERSQDGKRPFFASLSTQYSLTTEEGVQTARFSCQKIYKDDGRVESVGMMELRLHQLAPVRWAVDDATLNKYNDIIVKAIATFDMAHYKTFEHWEDCLPAWMNREIGGGRLRSWIDTTNREMRDLKSKARIDLVDAPADGTPLPWRVRFLYWNDTKEMGYLVISADHDAPILWEKS